MDSRISHYLLPVGVIVIPLINEAVFPLLPLFSSTYGIDIGTASLIVPALMLPFALSMLVSGAIAVGFGRKRLVVLGCLGMSLGSLLISLASSFEVAFVGRVFQGISAAFIMPGIIASIGDLVEKKSRGKVMGTFMLFITLGTALGPILGGWLGEFGGIKLVFMVLCIAPMLTAIYYHFTLAHFQVEADVSRMFSEIKIVLTSKAILGIGFAGGFIFISLIGSMTFSATVLAQSPFDLKQGAVGTILSLGMGSGILGAIIGGIATDKLGRVATVFLGLLTMLAGSMVLTMTALTTVVVGLKGFLLGLPMLGLGNGVAMTALETLSVEVLPLHRDAATSVFNALRFSCFAFAPVLAAFFYRLAGQTGAYAMLGSFLIFALVLFIVLSARIE